MSQTVGILVRKTGRPNTLIGRNVVQQVRFKRTAGKATKKTPAAAQPIVRGSSGNVSSEGGGTLEGMFVYGLRPVDYASRKPPITMSPLAPPPKPGVGKYAPWVTMGIFGAITTYFYFNNNRDNYEYWDTMQSGGALPDNYLDDEDDDDDDDDDIDE
eukprot:CAMPEP_0198288434 /NCGR_PEP_ID=MMETSP1449-20131203/6926_1 /TAXON_ID=420275 /ORGANISM="Attheya septentrionalis, Strain CCMP2084" /LENGTH=156 /DNA_ID=CAMNT_0043986567 /DNA_START=166 /DNA_END=636 /DNA_ORIENTATION=-